MFDERTIELYKLKNHVKGDVSIDNFTKYIERYPLLNPVSTTNSSTPG